MPDEIRISGIRGIGRHGVFAEERALGQEFIVDVCLAVSTRSAADSDELADTVDYGAVAHAVHELIVGWQVDLIETLAEQIAQACLRFSGVAAVGVTVHKPHAPIAVPFDDVTVHIERSRDA